ncbi:MAG: C39 family peptidase [Anaerotignaceae bacterium]
MRGLFEKYFIQVLGVSVVTFTVFSYLFATRITEPDINYFVVNTKEIVVYVGETVVEYVENTKEYIETKMEEKRLAEEAKLREEKRLAEEARRLEEGEKEKEEIVEDTDYITLSSNSAKVVYYNQANEQWGDTIYGEKNTIGVYGCGPTTMAMIVSSLTDTIITPPQMATWAYENGYFSNNSGSFHSIVPDSAAQYGLEVESLYRPSKTEIIDTLNQGNLITVLMKKGVFTNEGHFIILRGVAENGELLIADAKSYSNSLITWDADLIREEAKYSASAGGPFWVISPQTTNEVTGE